MESLHARRFPAVSRPSVRVRNLDRYAARALAEHGVFAGTVLLHVVLFLGVFFHAHADGGLRGFVAISFHDSGRTLAGAVPYRDFLLEYPPGLLLFMIVPHLFAAHYAAYRAPFFAEVLALDLVVVAALYATARAAHLLPARVLGLYTVAIMLLGPLVAYRLDLAPAALTALAVLAWQRDRAVLAAVVLAAGIATKGYPLLLLPPLILDQWGRGDARRALHAASAAVGTLALFLVAVLRAGPRALLASLRFQTGRHLQVESIWATIPWLLHLTVRTRLHIVNRHAFVMLGRADAFRQAGTPALALAVAFVYICWWRLRARRDLRVALLLTGTAALVLAATILTKVLSPQFLIWALPPLALLPAELGARRIVGVLAPFYVALPLTQWVFPLHYGALVRHLEPRVIEVLAARNVLLVAALFVLLSGLKRLERTPPAQYPAVAHSAAAR